MAITLVTNPYTGTAYTDSTSSPFLITFNKVSYLAGDMVVGIVAGKPYNTTFTVSEASGGGTWTSIGSFTDGATSSGLDTGSVKVEAFYKIATSASTGPDSVTSSSSSGRITGAIFFVFRSDTGYFETPVGGGGFGSGTPSYQFNLTSPAVLPVAQNDMVFAVCATNTDLFQCDTVVSGFRVGGFTLPSYADDIPYLTTLQSTLGNHLSMFTFYQTIPSALGVPGNLGVFGSGLSGSPTRNVVSYGVRLREASPPGGIYDPFGTFGIFGI